MFYSMKRVNVGNGAAWAVAGLVGCFGRMTHEGDRPWGRARTRVPMLAAYQQECVCLPHGLSTRVTAGRPRGRVDAGVAPPLWKRCFSGPLTWSGRCRPGW